VELAKPIGLRPLNPLYGMVNLFELHLTAQVEIFQESLHAAYIVSKGKHNISIWFLGRLKIHFRTLQFVK
jgi:hypothetical protein